MPRGRKAAERASEPPGDSGAAAATGSSEQADISVIVAFEASLPGGAKKPLSVDGDGEGTLQLALSQPEALRVMQAFPGLMDRSFYVVITPKPEGR